MRVLILLCLLFVLSFPSFSRADLREDWQSVFCGEGVSCYEVLGLNETCTTEEVVKAYKDLAKVLHPDKVPDPAEKLIAEEKFKDVVTAHEILKDPEKRKKYDEVTALKKRMWVPKEDPIVVLILCFALLVGIAHYYQLASYKDKKSKLLSHNAVVRRIRLKFKKDGKTVRTKNNKIEDEDISDELLNEIVKELNVRVPGGWTGEPPKIQDTLAKVPKVPILAIQYIAWTGKWVVKYTILGNEYDDDDKEYLTRVNAGFSEYDWNQLGDKEKLDFMEQELWRSSTSKKKKVKTPKKKQ